MRILRWSLAAVLLLTVVAVTTAPAQVTLQAGVGIGGRLPMADFGGSTTDFYNGAKYGLSTGLNLQGKARVGLLGFTLVGGIDYGMLSNSGDAQAGAGKLEVSQKILSFKVGPELAIGLPALPVKPYIGLNVSYNNFSGEVDFQGTSGVPTGTVTIESASRIGFGANIGALYSLNPMMTIDIGIEYALLNPFGKAWEDPNPTRDDQIDSYRALNDEKDPLIQLGGASHFIGAARSISTLSLNVALLFGI